MADEVAAKLGRPTVEGLRTRLTGHAPCMECGKPLGQGPVSVIGQQLENKALIVGTHETCRSSEWVRFEDVGELRVPWSGHGTAVIELPVWHTSLWRRLRNRLGGREPTTPALLVLPWLGWAWVEIVGPGETVNDDLSLYRNLGFAPWGASVPLAEAWAWFTSEGNLAVTVQGHPFGTHEPVTSEMRTRIRDAGVVNLVVASGVEIRHNESVRWSDLSDALAEGRMLTGEIELRLPPDEPGADGEATAPTTDSEATVRGDPTRLLVDDRTREALGPEGLLDVSRALWPLDCQTCGRALGDEAPALLVQDMGSFLVADLHHPGCQRPGWKDVGPVVLADLPTLSYTARVVSLPLNDATGASVPWPAMMVNPGLEAVMLERDPGDAWRTIVGAEFTDAGLAPLSKLRLGARRQGLPGATAKVDGASVVVTLPPPTRRVFSCPMTDDPTDIAIAENVRQLGGLVVGITHLANPAGLTGPGDLTAVFADGRIVLGWIAMAG